MNRDPQNNDFTQENLALSMPHSSSLNLPVIISNHGYFQNQARYISEPVVEQPTLSCPVRQSVRYRKPSQRDGFD